MSRTGEKTMTNTNEIKLRDEDRQECEVWTRVMGYMRPVSEFNKGKKSEFYTRTCFKEEKIFNEETLNIAAE